MDYDISSIGGRILKRRKQLGMTQEQAAEKAGLSHQFFSCVETNRKNLTAESVIKVAHALETSTDYILTGQPNHVDRNRIMEKINNLKDNELICLEKMIESYMEALGYK